MTPCSQLQRAAECRLKVGLIRALDANLVGQRLHLSGRAEKRIGNEGIHDSQTVPVGRWWNAQAENSEAL
jgi:hypothetical protein